jgi:3-dehydrosphinganine reductase
MPLSFSGKTFLITGGSSGIGLSLAKLAFRQGANVWILARNPDRLKEAVAEIEKERANPQQCSGMIVADVSIEPQVREALEDYLRSQPAPDYLINSAGVAQPGLIAEQPLNAYHWMMDINYFGTVNVTHALLPALMARGSGHIVNISSIAGYIGLIGYGAYSGTKFAVRGFTDALRAELKPKGVSVSIVFPPDTDTPQLHYERQYRPPITATLEKLVGQKTVSPDFVAGVILKGIQKQQYVILPGGDAAWMWTLSNLAGRFTYPILDWLIRMSHKRLAAENQQAEGNQAHPN